MSSYSRRYFRGYRSRFGYGRRGYNRSWRRRGWYRSTNSRSISGRKTVNVRVPVEVIFQFTIPTNGQWSQLACIHPYMDKMSTATMPSLGLGSAVATKLYQTYAEMYDQVKLNSMSIDIGLCDVVGAGAGAGGFPAVNMYTGWDRCVNKTELISSNYTVNQLKNGSEAQSYLITNNSRQVVRRWNRASDLQERTSFHDCTVSVATGSGYNYADEYCLYNDGLPFYCPGMYIAFFTPTVSTTGNRYINVSFKITYNFTFRNPKFGLSAGNAKGVETFGDVTKSIKSSDIVSASGRLKAARDEFVAGGLSSSKVGELYEDFKIVYEGLGEETFKEIFNGDFSQFVDKYKREEKDVGGDDDLIMGDLPEVKEA